MSDTRRALDAFSNAIRLSEESPALTQARQDYQANPDDENLKNRFSQLSIPAGYPDIHDAAVNFQNALLATSKMGHVRGWQGGEEELEALQQASQAHGIDPGLFVTPEGAGGSKREHVLQLTRLYGGKFLPGDGRSGMWDPMAHSFPDEQSAQGFAGAMQQYYPETQVQPQPVPTQVEQPGPDGQPVPSQEMVYNVALSHDDLGEPFPPGSKQFAAAAAQQRSAAAPHPHHVVVDQTGEHGVSLNPDPQQQQIVQTFVKGQPMQPVPEEGEPQDQEAPEEEPEEEPEAQEEPGPEGAEGGMPQGEPQGEPQGGPEGMPQESMDNIDRLLSDLGINNTARPQQSVVQESFVNNDLNEILGLYQNSTRRSPSLLMNETVSVDSNRGVTSRGNSQHDKYASPATREKVLKSRLDEIQAFARSRSIPLAGVLGAAEATMRTGKAPDMAQYGLSGDDAVATKQFLISNILNIQGLESVQHDGQSLSEDEDVGDAKRRSAMAKRIKRDHVKDGRLDYESMPKEVLQHLQDGGDRRAKGHLDMRENPPAPYKPKHKKPKHISWRDQAWYGNPGQERDGGMEESHGTPGRHPMSTTMMGRVPPAPNEILSPDALKYMKGKGKAPKRQRLGEGAKGKPQHGLTAKQLSRFTGKISKSGNLGDSKGRYGRPVKGGGRDGKRVSSGWGPSPEGREPSADSPEQSYDSDERNPIHPEEAKRTARDLGPAAVTQQQASWASGRPCPITGCPAPRGYKKQKPEQGEDCGFDPSRYMAEERPIRSQGRARAGNVNPGPGSPPVVGDMRKVDLLPKKVMQQLKKEIGDAVYGYSREELFAVARERGLLGTEESVAGAFGSAGLSEGRTSTFGLDSELARLLQRSPGKTLGGADLSEGSETSLTEHDYQAVAKKHGGKYLGYVQPHQAMYEFKNAKSAQKFANLMAAKTSSTPTVRGKRVSIDEPAIGESGHLGYAGHAGPGRPDSPHNFPGATKSPLLGDEKGPVSKKGKGKSKKRTEDRSFTDRILGIETGDPRGDSWPKMSDDMRKLLNLESNMSLAPRVGFEMDTDSGDPVQEATFGSSMGGFIGGGMKPLDLTSRTNQIPPYDASVSLDGSLDDKRRKYQTLLRNLGLRGE